MNRIYLTPAVKQITIACVVLYIGTILLKIKGIDLDNILAMHYPMNPDFKPWQIITHMFMHDSNGLSPHLIFNMFALISFGNIIENVFGTKRFVQLFFISGLGSIFLHLLTQTIMVHNAVGVWFPSLESLHLFVNDQGEIDSALPIIQKSDIQQIAQTYFGATLGASGAIYGITVAFAFFFPNTQLTIMFIPYPVKAKYLVPIIIGLDIYLGVSNYSWDPIAHFAHIGGALSGLLIAWYWRKFDKRRFF